MVIIIKSSHIHFYKDNKNESDGSNLPTRSGSNLPHVPNHMFEVIF